MVPGEDREVASGTGGVAPARVSVEREHERETGWMFEVTVARPGPGEGGGPGTTHEVTLSWVDYEHWSHGQRPPARVAQVVVEALLAARPELTLPARFDASTGRRWVRDLDERVVEGV